MSNPYQPYESQQPPQPYGQPPAHGQIPQQPYPSHDYPQQGQPPPAAPGSAQQQGFPPPAPQGYPRQPDYGQQPPPPPPGGYPAGYGKASVPSPTQYSDGGYDAPPARRRRWPIVLSILGVLLLAAGIVGWVFGKPIIDEYPARLSTPDTLVGHTRSTDPRLREAATQAVESLRADINLQDAIAEFYQDPNDETRIVWIVGGTKFILDPGTELNSAFESATDTDMSIDKPADVDPGPLGGVARCGEAKISESSNELNIAVCAWADHGSLVIGMFFNRTVVEGADLLRQIRAAILTR